MKKERFKFVIDNQLLYIGDDCIPINWITGMKVANSIVNGGLKYAIHLFTENMELELYFRSSDRVAVQDACDELQLAIIEAKRENGVTND